MGRGAAEAVGVRAVVVLARKAVAAMSTPVRRSGWWCAAFMVYMLSSFRHK